MDARALGRLLREAREARQISLADAEQALRIRRRILVAFEDGVFDLPDSSAVQMRGLLGNYARYLGLDDAGVLEQFQQVRQGAQRRQRRERRRTGRQQSESQMQPAPLREAGGGEGLLLRRRRRRNFLGALVVLALAAAALGVIAFVTMQILEEPESPPPPDRELPQLVAPTAPPTARVLQGGVAAPDLAPLRRQRQIAQNWNGSGVLVTVEAAQRTWLRLAADGEEEFAGMLRPGEHVEVAARGEIELRAGNAEALLITWNGQERDVPGLRGQMVEMVFTPGGVTIEGALAFGPTPVFTATARPTSAIDIAALLGTLVPVSTPGAALPGVIGPAQQPVAPAAGPVFPTRPASATPTASATASATPSPLATASATPSPSATAEMTPTASGSHTATAVLPPRVTVPPLTPAKVLQDGRDGRP